MQKHKKDHIKSGEWVATGAGTTGLTNHHDRIPGKVVFAVDTLENDNSMEYLVGV